MAAQISYPSVSNCNHPFGLAYNNKNELFLIYDKEYKYPYGGLIFNFCPFCGAKLAAIDLIKKGGGSCVECVDSE